MKNNKKYSYGIMLVVFVLHAQSLLAGIKQIGSHGMDTLFVDFRTPTGEFQTTNCNLGVYQFYVSNGSDWYASVYADLSLSLVYVDIFSTYEDENYMPEDFEVFSYSAGDGYLYVTFAMIPPGDYYLEYSDMSENNFWGSGGGAFVWDFNYDVY